LLNVNSRFRPSILSTGFRVSWARAEGNCKKRSVGPSLVSLLAGGAANVFVAAPSPNMATHVR
jgi:hypothetical protein